MPPNNKKNSIKSKHAHKFTIIIPAFNEERTIGWVCENIPKVYKDIIVINDGSTDQTEKIAKNNGAIVINHTKNKGYGAALQTGFNFVKKRYKVVITIDADAQHDPKELIRLLEPIKKGYDVVFGIRRLSFGKMLPLGYEKSSPNYTGLILDTTAFIDSFVRPGIG